MVISMRTPPIPAPPAAGTEEPPRGPVVGRRTWLATTAGIVTDEATGNRVVVAVVGRASGSCAHNHSDHERESDQERPSTSKVSINHSSLSFSYRRSALTDTSPSMPSNTVTTSPASLTR